MDRSRLRRRIAYGAGETSNVFTLLLFAVLARLLGVEPFGELAAILAATGILGTVTEFGFHTLLTRKVARHPDSAWAELTNAIGRQALLAVPMLVVLYLFMRIADISPSTHLAGMLIGLSVWLRALKETCRGVCRGLSRFDVEAVFLWTERAGLFVFCFLALALGGGLTSIGAVFLAVRALDFAIFIAIMRRLLGVNRVGNPGGLATWPAALPFAVSNVLFMMYYQVDTAMLSLLSSKQDTGLYGAVYRFVDLLQVLPRLFIVVVFPTMAVAWLGDRDRFSKLVQSLRNMLSALALPVVGVTMLFSAPLLRLAFGPEYEMAAPALRLLALGNFAAFQSLLLAQTLQSSAHERLLARTLATTVVLNVLMNAVLIPRYGFLGAAAATVVTELLYFVGLAIGARQVGATSEFAVGALEVLGAAILVSFLFQATGVWLILQIGMGVAVWCVLLWRVRNEWPSATG